MKEVFSIEGEGVLLISDGFDEMPTSVVQDKGSFLMRLIHGNPCHPTCLPKATRLVTSRPSAFHRKEECFPREYRHIEILGFTSDKPKVRYAELAFKSEPEVLASFKKLVLSNHIIRSLMYIPVNCAILARVYKSIMSMRSSKSMPTTMTELYSAVIPVHIKRYMIENAKWDIYGHEKLNCLEELPEELVTALNRVCELAYNGLHKDDIQIVFTDSDVGEDFQHLGLLSEAKEMYISEGAVSSYSFLHLSIQEFLAAWHVKCHPEVAVSLDIKLMARKRLLTFGYFLAGLIGCEKSKCHEVDSKGFLFMCMYEAQDCSHLPLLIKNRVILSYCSLLALSRMEMYAFAYVLAHAPVQWHVSIPFEPTQPHFETFALSLQYLASFKDQTAKGSIKELIVENIFWPSACYPLYDHLMALPVSLLPSITQFEFRGFMNSSVSMLCMGLPALVNLQKVKLCHGECQDDYLLYRSLRNVLNLKRLKRVFDYITLKVHNKSCL